MEPNNSAITTTIQEELSQICQDIQNNIQDYDPLLTRMAHALSAGALTSDLILELIGLCDKLESYEALLEALLSTGVISEIDLLKPLQELQDIRDKRSKSSVIADTCNYLIQSNEMRLERELLLSLQTDFIFRNRINTFNGKKLIETRNKLEEIDRDYLEKKQSFYENWAFFLEPEENSESEPEQEHKKFFTNNRLKKLTISNKNHNVQKILNNKFGVLLSPSSYIVTLDKKCSYTVLRHAPREIRQRLFEGLHKLGSLEAEKSYFLFMSKTITNVLELRQKISKLCNHSSVLGLQQQLNPISIPFTECLSYYKELLPALLEPTKEKLKPIKTFALWRDGLSDFAPWDFYYYKRLWAKSQLQEDPLFRIDSVFDLIGDQLDVFFDLGLRKTSAPLLLSSSNVVAFELFHKITHESFGLLCCDLFDRTAKNHSAKKSFFIDSDGSRIGQRFILVCFSFKEYKQRHIHFHDLLKLSQEVGLAISTLLWRKQVTHAALLKNIFPDIKLFIGLFIKSWFLEEALLSKCQPNLSPMTIKHLIASYGLRDSVEFFKTLKIAYFDSVVHSESYPTIFRKDSLKYSPAQVWQRLSENYNLYENDDFCVSDESPLTHSLMFSKTYQTHTHIIAHMYYAQTTAKIAEYSSINACKTLLFDCLFQTPLLDIGKRLQRDFFEEELMPSYLISKSAQAEQTPPLDRDLLFSRVSAHSFDSTDSSYRP